MSTLPNPDDYADLDAIARHLRSLSLHAVAQRVECAAAVARRQERLIQTHDAAVIASAGNVVRLERRVS